MNIFYFSHDFKENAMFHCNKHTTKMIVEQTQILSTAHRVLDGKETVEQTSAGRKIKRFKLNSKLDSILYKSTHVNHPSVIWARTSLQNYIWLANMTKALCEEYTYRYGKIHKCQEIGLVDLLITTPPDNIADKIFTEPTPAMESKYIVVGDSIASYRNYFNNAKQHLFDWEHRQIPHWVNI